MPIKLELVTKKAGNKNGTRIYWYPIEVEIEGKVVVHNLVYFKGGDMRQGFTDSVHGIGQKTCNKVWGILTSLTNAVRKKFAAERLTEDERRGQYDEAIQHVVDEIDAALVSGELPDGNAAILRVAHAAELSYYSGILALDAITYTDRNKTLHGLARQVVLADILEQLRTRPSFVTARVHPNA